MQFPNSLGFIFCLKSPSDSNLRFKKIIFINHFVSFSKIYSNILEFEPWMRTPYYNIGLMYVIKTWIIWWDVKTFLSL